MIVKCADIEDWDAILVLWRQLKDDPRQSNKIDGDEGTLKGFLKGSFTSPYLRFWIAVEDQVVRALGIAQISVIATPADNGQVTMMPNLFIRAVYADQGGNPRAVRMLSETAENFARISGCASIFGNCRMNFPYKAALRAYGYDATHVVMRKDLK